MSPTTFLLVSSIMKHDVFYRILHERIDDVFFDIPALIKCDIS